MADLNVRPVFHCSEKRVRMLGFLCMRAYCVDWHLRARQKPMLSDEDCPHCQADTGTRKELQLARTEPFLYPVTAARKSTKINADEEVRSTQGPRSVWHAQEVSLGSEIDIHTRDCGIALRETARYIGLAGPYRCAGSPIGWSAMQGRLGITTARTVR